MTVVGCVQTAKNNIVLNTEALRSRKTCGSPIKNPRNLFMSGSLSFAAAAQAIPELTTLKDSIEVVIIGYHHCPFSKRALAAKDRHPRWRESGRVLFVGYDFGATGPFKQASKYRGSFPIVYVKKDGKFEHIGGGDDFDAYVTRELASKQGRPSLIL